MSKPASHNLGLVNAKSVDRGDVLRRVNAPQRFFTGFGNSIREIWGFRELLVNLTRKELKVRYRDSVLGFLWSIQLPIVQLLVYWLVVGQFLAGGKVPYYGIFMFSGLALWSLFSEGLTSSTGSIVINSGLVKKVYFPRELMPLAAIGASVLNFGIQFCVLLTAVIGAGLMSDTWPNLEVIWLPMLGFMTIIVFATAMGMLLSALNVYLRDVEHLVAVVSMLWFWMTPILYSAHQVQTSVPKLVYQIYLLNPITPVVFSFQKFFWPQGAGTVFDFDDHLTLRLVGSLGCSLILLWVGQRVFARVQGNFAQEL